MGLFGNREEKAAKAAEAQAESDRLAALPANELAVEVMAAFGPGGLEVKRGHQQGAVQIATWLLQPLSSSTRHTQPVLGPTIEALNVLEAGGLVESRQFGNGKTFHATRRGEEALADGSVASRLG